MRHSVRLVPLLLSVALAAPPSRAQQDAEVEADAHPPQAQKKIPNRGVFLKPGVRPGAPVPPANQRTNAAPPPVAAPARPAYKNSIAPQSKPAAAVPAAATRATE